MTRSEILREQADVLWTLAESSGASSIRQDLRHLAALCEEMIADLRDTDGDLRHKPTPAVGVAAR